MLSNFQDIATVIYLLMAVITTGYVMYKTGGDLSARFVSAIIVGIFWFAAVAVAIMLLIEGMSHGLMSKLKTFINDYKDENKEEN